MSKILILHATVGTGHKTAAVALEKAFKQRSVDKVWVQDTLDYGSGIFRKLYADLYIELSERTPELWGFAYNETNREQSDVENQLRHLYSRVGVYKIDELRELNPDAIVCTHFLPLDAVKNSLRDGRISTPVFCVVTDYVGHPFWAHPELTGTFVGNEMTRDMLSTHGVPAERIFVTGIPVDPAIARPKDAQHIRSKQGLAPGPLILLIGSGIDNDRVRQIATGLLERPIAGTLIVVAGRNHTLEASLADLHGTDRLHLDVRGYVSGLDDLVAASDLVITKSGGLITSEVMARGTPLLVIDPIRGQEEYNADYIAGIGAGVQARTSVSVPYMVETLVNTPERLAQLRSSAARFGRPNAAVDIADKVLAAIGQGST